jgi:heme/copper-type cytochrome/quinol oxidase subunit 2
MRSASRTLSFALIGAGVCLLIGPAVVRLFAQPPTSTASASPPMGQEQAPNRREFTLTARDYRFSPDRIEVIKDDLVKITVQSADHAYSVTIDEYRLSKRVPAGGSTVIEFRADQMGTFSFYSNMTSDSRHAQMRGQLVVRAK